MEQRNLEFPQMDAYQWAMEPNPQVSEPQPLGDENFESQWLQNFVFEDENSNQTGDNDRQGQQVQPEVDEHNIQLLDMQRHNFQLHNMQLEADVENPRRLLAQENPDQHTEHITSWSELLRLEQAELRLAAPAPDLSRVADFPPDSQDPALARRLVDAMNNLNGIEDRATLPSGADSAAIKCLKVKKPVEKQMRAWKLVVSLDLVALRSSSTNTANRLLL